MECMNAKLISVSTLTVCNLYKRVQTLQDRIYFKLEKTLKETNFLIELQISLLVPVIQHLTLEDLLKKYKAAYRNKQPFLK